MSIIVPKIHKAGFYVAVLVWAVGTYFGYIGIDVLSSDVLAIKAQRIGIIISFLVTSAILFLVMKQTVKINEESF